MTTSIKNIILFAVIAISFASCSTDGIEAIISADHVTERVDLLISGDNDEYIYEQSQQSDASIDLVDFNHFQSSSDFSFEVRLSNDKTLNVILHDENSANPWSQEGIAFDVFAKQVLNDKSRYVTFEMIDNSISETRTYTSNHISNHHAILNAFSIQEYNYIDKEILCRMNDVQLIDINNSDNQLTLNGTFKGAITFE